MARKRKTNGTDKNDPDTHKDAEGSGIHHNSSVRNAAINTYFAERYDVERSIALAIEKHVKPLRDERNKLNKNFRADLGMNEADVKGDYFNFKRLQEIELFDDAGEADAIRDNMLEIRKAVYGEGGQMEWDWPKAEAAPEGDKDVRPNFLKQQEADREKADA